MMQTRNDFQHPFNAPTPSGDSQVQKYIEDAKQTQGQPTPNDHPQFTALLEAVKNTNDHLRALRLAIKPERWDLDAAWLGTEPGGENVAQRQVIDRPVAVTICQVFTDALGAGSLYLFDQDGQRSKGAYDLQDAAAGLVFPSVGLAFMKNLSLSIVPGQGGQAGPVRVFFQGIYL